MTRVSLTEDYDDRSVISKLNEMDKRVKENASVVTSAEASARQSAQSAQETADRFAGSVGAVVQNANAQINASKAQVDKAKTEVDQTVTTVAQAVQTANQASASAQQSATTVATYGTRLTAVEDKAQGNSADIDHLEIETRDLYDRDANNVKLHANYTQIMEGGLDVGNPLITHGTETQKTSIPTSSTTYTERNIKEVLDANGTRFMRRFLVEQNNTKSVMTNLYGNDGNSKIQLNDSISADGTVYTRQLIKNNHYVNAETINDAGQLFQYGSSPVEGSLSSTLVNKAYVEATNPATRLNNLVHNVDAETISGQKTFVETINGIANKKIMENSGSITRNKYLVWRFPLAKIDAFRGRAVLLFLGRTRLTLALGSLYYHSGGSEISFGGVTLIPGGNNAEFTVSSDDTYMYICQKGNESTGQDAFKVSVVWAVDLAWKIDYATEGETPVLMDAIPGTTHGSMVVG